MSARRAINGMAGCLFLTTLAFVQTPTLTSKAADKAPVIAPDPSSSANSFTSNDDWRASKLIGLGVYNTHEESLGTISDLLIDGSGHIQAVVIGFGGLLGVGAHQVAVPFDKVKFSDQRISYTAAAGSPHASGEASSTNTVGANTMPPPASKSDSPDHAIFNATKEQLRAMPEFTYPT